MANELILYQGIRYTKGVLRIASPTPPSKPRYVSIAGSQVHFTTQSIPTGNGEQLDFGELAINDAWFMLENLDASNFVYLYYDNPAASGVVISKVKAGEIAGPLRLGFDLVATGMWAAADTAAVEVALILVEP